VLVLLVTAVFGSQFPRIHIDTDPENMLEADQPDRVVYNLTKREFGIHDMIVLGITDEEGVFRPETLARVERIVEGILRIRGVITDDVISLTTTDDVKSEAGLLDVRRIMEAVPTDDAGALSIRDAIEANPLLSEKIASRDGKGIAIYVPIERKDQAHRVGNEIETIVSAELAEGQAFHLAGLPVAEDTFGVEMFQQMGRMAPLTGLVILLLLWVLFRRLALVIPSMVVAMFSVVWGMGLLVGTGATVHIMSSMIPVFLMPIAVLDSVHILSEFYDRYPHIRDRRETLRQSMESLFTPLLYTSVTSAVGFGSLMLAPIPPVRVFGGFVAFGIMSAWLLTITVIPASIMLIREERLKATLRDGEQPQGVLGRLLSSFGRGVLARRRTIAVAGLVLLAVGVFGVSRIVVNDNPVNWFAEGHRLRIADREMNRLFGGTYMAYLVLEGEDAGVIKDPEVLSYVAELQRILKKDPVVGKTSSLADIVAQVGTVLHDGDPAYRVIPANPEELGQYLFLFEMSGDPGDLDNFVDYDYRYTNVWVQMKRGDNKDMMRVEESLAAFMDQHPPPDGITVRWSGLTYINKVWQELMVVGMRNAILGGFAAVFLLMVILFRSPLLGLISMLPLTFAIVLSYGLVGLVGKDYDMPIAVCSSLALGLSIDFAIHFVQRFRSQLAAGADAEAANRYVFREPARAIARNALVIIVGFLPMVLATLTPYKTVGAFFALLMTFSVMTTLGLLPGFLYTTAGRFFRPATGLVPDPRNGDNQ
jgi:predicted RND superfamily exporter protein